MSYLLPVTNEPAQLFEIEIEGGVYVFRVLYNSFADSWAFDIYKRDNTALLTGIKVVLNRGLVAKFELDDLFKGELVAIDTSNSLNNVGRDDLGSAVKLIYVTEAERNAVI